MFLKTLFIIILIVGSIAHVGISARQIGLLTGEAKAQQAGFAFRASYISFTEMDLFFA